MPRNGSGTYTLPGSSFTSGAVIESSAMNAKLSDLAQAMTGSLAKDGQTTPTANQAMGGFVHTNVGDASLRNQYASAGQVQDSPFLWGGTAGGSTTALTISLSPAPPAYAAGQAFSFVTASNFAGVGGPATLNVSSLGAKSILKLGVSELATNDFASNTVVRVIYDGTAFQMLAPVPKNIALSSLTIAALADADGDVRDIPRNSQTTGYTLVEADAGKYISITTGGVTCPASVFVPGQAVCIYNDSASNQTVTQGGGVTLRLAGSATTGSRTLAQRGLATVFYVASNEAVMTGAGIS